MNCPALPCAHPSPLIPRRRQVNGIVARQGAGVLEDFKAALTNEVRVLWAGSAAALANPAPVEQLFCLHAGQGMDTPQLGKKLGRPCCLPPLRAIGCGGPRSGGARAVPRFARAVHAAAAQGLP